MFGKMLRYDLKALYTRMRPIAITSLALNIVSALCMRILSFAKGMTLTEQITRVFSNVFSFLAIASVFILALTLPFFIGERFYRNFFSDEGYLTFTLPLSRKALLGSKMLCAMIYFSALCVFLVAVLVIYLVIIPEEGHFAFAHNLVYGTLRTVFRSDSLYAFFVRLESVAIVFACGFLLNSLLFLCLSAYARNMRTRPKWLIVLYFFIGYVVLQIVAVFLSLGLINVIDALSSLLSQQTRLIQKTWTLLFLMQIFVAVSFFGTVFYNRTLSGIENKLNLN